MRGTLPCPHCAGDVPVYRNPVPTVDVVIFAPDRGVVLVKRRNPPEGWALPGGFIDYGESAEAAAIREAKEETGLDVTLTGLLGVYSRPDRDPRQHTMSVVFMAQALDPEMLRAGDDAAGAAFHPLERRLSPIAFDHATILSDFERRLQSFTRNL